MAVPWAVLHGRFHGSAMGYFHGNAREKFQGILMAVGAMEVHVSAIKAAIVMALPRESSWQLVKVHESP